MTNRGPERIEGGQLETAPRCRDLQGPVASARSFVGPKEGQLSERTAERRGGAAYPDDGDGWLHEAETRIVECIPKALWQMKREVGTTRPSIHFPRRWEGRTLTGGGLCKGMSNVLTYCLLKLSSGGRALRQ